MDSEKLLMAGFIALESAHLYSARLPSSMTIAAFVDSPEKADAIKSGIMEASLMSFGIGAAASLLLKSWLPLLFTMGTIILFDWLYWRDLSKAPFFSGKGSDHLGLLSG